MGAVGLGCAALGFDKALSRAHAATPSFDTKVRYPGKELGHLFRDTRQWSAADIAKLPIVGEHDTAIVGSGVAALSCAWKLNQAGMTDFVMLEGPAPLGNASSGTHAFSAYPQGAHYLPVPSRSCMHVRDILQDLGVLVEGINDEAPVYDERYLVHASAERVLHGDKWHSGLVPDLGANSPAAKQWAHVTAELQKLSSLTDSRGTRMFQVPIAQGMRMLDARDNASLAQAWALDSMSFSQWLESQGVTDPTLRWYFDYCCRDEYGADASLTSAWAGVHYFGARHGKAANAQEGAVLTWPNGLGFLAQGLSAKIAPSQRRALTALRIASSAARATASKRAIVVQAASGKVGVIYAQHVVVATPLFVARRLSPESFEGLQDERGLPSSPWLVANFALSRFPAEKSGEALSWDNVVAGSKSLGYIVATHQAIRAAKPDGTVFTAYHALGEKDNRAARKHLVQASPAELVELATVDLDAAYGKDWRKWCKGAELTVHGHAMATPCPGFLSDKVIARARAHNNDKRGLSFAHSDLSGYSVFEEASYWGVQAAQKRLTS